MHLVCEFFLLGWALQRFTRYKRTGRVLKIISLVLFVIFGCGIGTRTYLYNLERKYIPFDPTIEQQEELQGAVVVVLGQGMPAQSDLPVRNQNNAVFERRLFEGVRVTKLIPDSRLIVSMTGDATDATKQQFLDWYMSQLHFPVNRVSMFTAARDTRDEVKLTLESIRENNLLSEGVLDVTNISSRLIVVTSASHIPRSLKIFQKVGIFPIPAPCDYTDISKPRRLFQRPSGGNFDVAQRVTHEWLGSLYESLF